jgi:hypothetical protein
MHTPATPEAARRVFRARLHPPVTDIPGIWFGGQATPGVRGIILGNYMALFPVPPNRTLLSSRKAPTVLGRIVPRSDGGSDVRISIYTPGFPYHTIKDPPATELLDRWLDEVGRELGVG